MQVVTAIGYGDVTVTSSSMKLFMSFYVLGCLVLVAQVMNMFIQSVVNRQSQALQRFIRETKWREDKWMRSLKQLGSSHEVSDSPKTVSQVLPARRHVGLGCTPLLSSTILLAFAITCGAVFFAVVEPCECSYVRTYVEDCDQTTDDTCRETGGFVKSWIDSFFMSVITVTTVGFGACVFCS
eukprot:TRINITY_DN63698_c0_g1_i1.p1 TRINITY_DN63698_c0_g1~~TRINITY_DN63698_c0_g1_i1.p1  ORF type:complete len:182 (+),score=23.74 TRINITY_DN63698_c0_g1_i1:384-929(+)